jgi:hypothetical protein
LSILGLLLCFSLNPEWTIRWYRQHWVQDTQQRKSKEQTQNGQSGDTGNIEYSMLPVSPDCPFWICPFDFLCCVSCTQCCLYHQIVHSGFAPLIRGKPRMDNLVIQATLGTRHTTEKNKGANPEWTIWWYRQHWVQDTQQRIPKGQTQNGQSGDTGNNVACITRLSILGLPFCFSLLCVLYPMLPVSPDCPFWVFPFSFL